MATAFRGMEIGLVNSMPKAAREATTRQFKDLLDTAGAPVPRLRLFTLSENVDGSLDYAPVEAIFESGIDALIFTGTEPTKADLRDEPYWPRLTELLDWTEENGVPAIFSCLAAHAAALHWDGIVRRPLAEKCFGVFEVTMSGGHPLMRGVSGALRIPHSRWNELSVTDLTQAGYQVVTSSPAAGADMCVRQGRAMSVFFQGHPEYEADRLLLEYRRDARRYIAGARPTYPNLPRGYFDRSTEGRLKAFKDQVMRGQRDIDFPAEIAAPPSASWRPKAEGVFRNWLNYVHEREA
jgi:homoserine O-succinyltransferase/O-acetyltransferase